METDPERVANLIVKEKMRDMGDIKETTCDGAYRSAIIEVLSNIDWDFEEESIKELEESYEDQDNPSTSG